MSDERITVKIYERTRRGAEPVPPFYYSEAQVCSTLEGVAEDYVFDTTGCAYAIVQWCAGEDIGLAERLQVMRDLTDMLNLAIRAYVACVRQRQ